MSVNVFVMSYREPRAATDAKDARTTRRARATEGRTERRRFYRHSIDTT